MERPESTPVAVGFDSLPEEIVSQVFGVLLASSELNVEKNAREASRQALVSLAASSNRMLSILQTLLQDHVISFADVLTSTQARCAVCNNMHNQIPVAATYYAFDRMRSARLVAICACHLAACVNRLSQLSPRLRHILIEDILQERNDGAETDKIPILLRNFAHLTRLRIYHPNVSTLNRLHFLRDHLRQLHLCEVPNSHVQELVRYLSNTKNLHDFKYGRSGTTDIFKYRLAFVHSPNGPRDCVRSHNFELSERLKPFVGQVAGQLLNRMTASMVHVYRSELDNVDNRPCSFCEEDRREGRLSLYEDLTQCSGAETMYRAEFWTFRTPHDDDFFCRLQKSTTSDLRCIASIEKNVLMMPNSLSDNEAENETVVIKKTVVKCASLFDALHPSVVSLRDADCSHMTIVETTIQAIGGRSSIEIGERCLLNWGSAVTSWLRQSSDSIQALSLKYSSGAMIKAGSSSSSWVDRLFQLTPHLQVLDACVELFTHVDTLYDGGLPKFFRLVSDLCILHIRKPVVYFASDLISVQIRFVELLPNLLNALIHGPPELRLVELHGRGLVYCQGVHAEHIAVELHKCQRVLKQLVAVRPFLDVSSIARDVQDRLAF